MRNLEKKTRDAQDAVSRISEMTVTCDLGSIFADPFALTPSAGGFSLPHAVAIGLTGISSACYLGVLTASVLAWDDYEDYKSKLDVATKKYDDDTISPSELKDGVIASVVSVLSVLFYFFVLHAHALPHLMNQHRQHTRTRWFFMNGPLKH